MKKERYLLAMKVTSQLIRFIRQNMRSCEIDTKARFARASGISEPTIGRILAGKRETISDQVAEKLCRLFNMSMEELVMIAMGHRDSVEKQDSTINEDPAPPYGRGSSATLSPDLARLFQWLENDASPEQTAAVLATARAVGCPNGSTNSSHSGTGASQSAAKVA